MLPRPVGDQTYTTTMMSRFLGTVILLVTPSLWTTSLHANSIPKITLALRSVHVPRLVMVQPIFRRELIHAWASLGLNGKRSLMKQQSHIHQMPTVPLSLFAVQDRPAQLTLLLMRIIRGRYRCCAQEPNFPRPKLFNVISFTSIHTCLFLLWIISWYVLFNFYASNKILTNLLELEKCYSSSLGWMDCPDCCFISWSGGCLAW